MLAGLAGVVLLVSTLISSVSTLHHKRADMLGQLEGLAAVVATNSEAAILFKDSRAAADSLASLSALPEILGACIETDAKQVFAQFPASAQAALFKSVETRALNQGLPWLASRAHFVYPIHNKAEARELGHLSLVVDLRDMWGEFFRDILLMLLAGTVLFVLALLTAQRLARRISEPIEAMAQTSRHVGQTGHYGLRLKKTSNDEVGELVDAFNKMLSEIDARDKSLQYQQAHLEQQVQMRTAELELARDAAEAASRAKSDFLASMSHELRTPLNAVLGFSQLMRADETLPTQAREQAAEVERAGRHLLALVNDVIDMARIESGRMQVSMEPVLVRQLFEECCELVSVQAQKGGVDIQLPEFDDDLSRLTVNADAVRLRQALVNLLSNAIKYNRLGGWVRLSVDLVQAKVRIQVQDSGPGIELSKQSRIFKAFDRLGAEFGVIEGSGIGLAITRRLVQAMGGEIGFWSRPGEGSLFWIELAVDVPVEYPLRQSKTARSHSPTPGTNAKPFEVSPAQVLKVLAVEDNPVNMLLIRLAMDKRHQVKLSEATTAEQALSMTRQEVPDLILMDINLPGMNGYQALTVLRAEPQTANVHVAALTASAMKEDQERGLSAGFDDYLTKPINLRELNELIDKVLLKTGKRDVSNDSQT